jgi:site-specific recombinase XerD
MTIDRNRAAAAHPIPCIGALAPHFDGFSALLAGKGYSASTLLNKRELVAILSRWLKQRRMSLIRLDEALLKTFHAGYRGTMRRGDVSCGRKLLSYLRGAGAIPKPAQKIDRTALGQLTRDYEHCLTSERGLAGATVINNLRIVRQFLTAYFEDPARRMQDLQPQDLHRFILKEAHRVSRCQAQITAGRLRSFVRFLRQRGIVKTDLAVSIPRVRRYKLSQLPKFLPREQIERVLKACVTTRCCCSWRDWGCAPGKWSR